MTWTAEWSDLATKVLSSPSPELTKSKEVGPIPVSRVGGGMRWQAEWTELAVCRLGQWEARGYRGGSGSEEGVHTRACAQLLVRCLARETVCLAQPQWAGTGWSGHRGPCAGLTGLRICAGLANNNSAAPWKESWALDPKGWGFDCVLKDKVKTIRFRWA